MKAALNGDKTERGASTVELLIALAVMMLGIGAVVLVGFGSQSLAVDTQTNSEALYKARQQLEEARAEARANFNTTPAPLASDGYYSYSLSASYLNPCLKRVLSRVNWAVETRPQYVNFSSFISDPLEAVQIGSDCYVGSLGSGGGDDWRYPKLFASDNFNPGKPVSLDVLKKKVYVTSTHKPYLWIADAANATLGQNDGLFVDQFSNGFDAGVKLNDIDAAEWADPATSEKKVFAYVARNTDTEQLGVIDVTDIQNPALVTTKTLKNVKSFTDTPPGSYPQGWRVYYYKDRLYITTRETGGREFHVFNVSDPTNPTEVGGGYELNRTVNDFMVREEIISGTPKTIAYLATSASGKEITVLDVTNPASITEYTTDISGPEDALSLYALGNRLYLGRETNSGAEFYIYDISDPLVTPLPIASPSPLNLSGNNADVPALRVSGDYAFLAVDNTTEEFQVWNTAQSTLTKQNINPYNFANVASDGMDYEHDFIYIGSMANDALQIVYSAPAP